MLRRVEQQEARDIRMHDTVAYMNRELGRFQVLDEIPEVT